MCTHFLSCLFTFQMLIKCFFQYLSFTTRNIILNYFWEDCISDSLALCINPPPTAPCEIFHLVLVFVLQRRSEYSQSILSSSDLPDFLTSTLPFPSTVLWNKLKTREIFHYLVDFAVFKTDSSTSSFCLSTAVLPLFWKGTYNIVFQGFTTKGKLLGQNLYSSFTIQTAFLKPSCSQCPLQTVAQLEWLLALDSWLPTF